MYIGKKKDKRIIKWKSVVDALSIVIGIATIISAVYIFLFVEERIKWLPVMFLGAALVNLIEGCKKFYYGKYPAGILFLLSAVAVTAFAVVSYLVVWQAI